MQKLEIVAVVGADGSIGRNGDLIRHLSEDLRHFKRLTMGGTVIMGRKTWESLPRRPLPGRLNIVVTHNKCYEAPGAEVVDSIEAACRLASQQTPEARLFVIGGGEIYRQAMLLTSVLHLTEVAESCPDADTFFPEVKESEWQLTERIPGSEGNYSFCSYTRK